MGGAGLRQVMTVPLLCLILVCCIAEAGAPPNLQQCTTKEARQ